LYVSTTSATTSVLGCGGWRRSHLHRNGASPAFGNQPCLLGGGYRQACFW
jgi:hypothetical protein